MTTKGTYMITDHKGFVKFDYKEFKTYNEAWEFLYEYAKLNKIEVISKVYKVQHWQFIEREKV